MLTVSSLLEDAALELTLVVPGPAGALDREVLWLHNTELPDPSPYIRPTELVLTNGLWLDTVAAGRVRRRAATRSRHWLDLRPHRANP